MKDPEKFTSHLPPLDYQQGGHNTNNQDSFMSLFSLSSLTPREAAVVFVELGN